MEYKDYYKILGVSKTADEKEIKKAYRQLARQYHPDKNQGDKASEDKFKDVNEAYEVLSDPEKRQKYDRFGAQWEQVGQGGSWGDRNGRQTYTQTITPEEFEAIFGQGARAGGNSGFSSFFESLFGDLNGQSINDYGSFQQVPRSRDLTHTVEVTLVEAFHGATRTLQWEDGRSLTAKIPRGVKTGSRIRLNGQGQDGGDLYLEVVVFEDGRFQRKGDDLYVTTEVDLYTMMLGGKAAIPTLTGDVKLTIPEGTVNGRQFRLRGQGMPQLKQPDQRGDLFVTATAQLPTNLTEEEKELIKQLREMRRN